MRKKTKREENYGKYIFRRKRGDKVELFARVGYYDENGLWKYKYEKAADEDDAKTKAKKIIQKYKKRGTAYIDGSQMTFAQFADWYREKYLVEPVYEQGQQVSGLRTYKKIIPQLEKLKVEFAKKKICKIDGEILTQFKNKRKNIDKVKTATINRDLELLRAMFGKAVKQGWLEESPFARSENLIRKSLEARRNVTVTADEERLVLELAQQSSNVYLYPLILALRDTGARPSELFPYGAFGTDLSSLAEKIKLWLETEVKADEQVFLPLCWFQLFKVEFRVVPLISLKSRQVEYRFGPMSGRLRESLLNLWEKTDKNPVSLVFPFKTIKREWEKIRESAALYTIFTRLKNLDDEAAEAELQKAFGAKSAVLLKFLDDNLKIEELVAKAKELDVEILRAEKLKDLRIRDWRRIWRSKADLAGIPDQTAQRILGHKLLQTSYHYNEADLDAVVEASRRLDEQNLISDKIN